MDGHRRTQDNTSERRQVTEGRRHGCASAIDLCVIVLCAAAIVEWLGGRTRLDVAGTHLRLVNPLRPGIAAAVLTATRFALAREVPLLAALRTRGIGADLTSRARFMEAAPLTRAWWHGAAGLGLLSVVWIAPHLLHPRRVADAGDPVFSAWRLARVAHQLSADPLHVFDGNIFHPVASTLAYSDATLLQGFIAAPFILLGADPLVVSNLLMMATFPLCALAFYYAAWRLTGRVDAAFIAGIGGALYPFRFQQYSHAELQFTGFIPLAAVALLDVVAKPTVPNGLRFGVLIVGQWLAGMYLGLMLMVWLLPIGSVAAIAWARARWTGVGRSLGPAALMFALLCASIGPTYFRAGRAHGDWEVETIERYSADGPDYLRPNVRMRTYFRPDESAPIDERLLFPGLGLPALAVPALVPVVTVPVVALTFAGAAAFDWSRGLHGLTFAGAGAFDWSRGLHGLTYDDMYRRFPPLRAIRVPARFGLFVGTSLVLLAALGSARIFGAITPTPLRLTVCACVAAALLVELRPALSTQTYWTTPPPIYAAVNDRMVLAEFPMNSVANIAYMYFSTRHWARLVNGYSGFFPEHYVRLERMSGAFPSAEILDAIRQAGASHLTVNCRFYGARCPAILEKLDASRRVQLVSTARWEEAEVRLYELLR